VDFLSDRRDVVMVIGNGNFIANDTFVILENGPSGPMTVPFTPYDWICGGTTSIPLVGGFCSIKHKLIDPNSWTMEAGPFLDTTGIASASGNVQYCLSETTPSKCQLQFNLPLLALVVLFNFIKVICMATVAIRMRDNPLVTVGDAIASFTANPDPLTKDMCLVSQRDFLDKKETRAPIPYQPRRTRWMATASEQHWLTICTL
jgi:hypothetical protein